MANGLLDFFGKDYEDPRTQGLLQFGLGLMQQGGYQDRPVSLGQAFGAAGQQGMQAYQQAVAQKQKKQQLADAKKLQDLQVQQIQAKLASDASAAESLKKTQLARKRFANFQNMVKQGGGMIPQGTNIEAEAMRLFSEAYPAEYARMVTAQMTPKDPISVKAGETLLDPETYDPLFTAPFKPSSTSPVVRDLATSPTTQATFVVDPVAGTETQISEERPIFAPKADKPEKEDPYKLNQNITLFDAEGVTSQPVYTKVVDNIERAFVEDDTVPDGFRRLMPSEIMMTKQFDAQKPSDAYFNAAYEEITGQQKGVRSLENFVNALDGVEGGFKGFFQRRKADIQAIIGSEVDETAAALKLLDAMQQGQLGALRLEVVGPGVMTEQDAQRLIAYMGGSLQNITTSPELVKKAMASVLRDKKKDVDKAAGVFNKRLTYLLSTGEGTRGGYAPFSMYAAADNDSSDTLSPAQEDDVLNFINRG